VIGSYAKNHFPPTIGHDLPEKVNYSQENPEVPFCEHNYTESYMLRYDQQSLELNRLHGMSGR